MRLKKINIFGFKSFGKKEVLEFNDGISGIVGPNGCGKTNIIDSIRWALGETNSRLLRLEKAEDIIFDGTLNKNSQIDIEPLSFCEVEAIFESIEDTSSPYGFSELSIKRKLKRDGASEFFINQTPCLLRDIYDALLNIGISSRSYSLFSRDSIGEIIKDPHIRREMIEQVAGLSKYQRQKNTTLNRLKNTKDDIVRLNDRIDEIQTGYKRAKREANKASRYINIKNEFNEKFKIYSKIKLNNIENEIDNKEEKLLSSNKKREELSNELKQFNSELSNLREDESKLNVNYSNFNEKYKNTEVLYSNKKLTYEQNLNSINNIKTEKERFIEQKENLDRRMPELLDELDEIKKSNKNIENEISDYEIEKEKLISNLTNFSQEYDDLKQNIIDNENSKQNLFEELTELNRVMAIEDEKKRSRLGLEIKLEGSISKRDLDIIDVEEKKAERIGVLDNNELERQNIEKKLIDLNEKLYSFQKQFESNKENIQKFTTTRNSLVKEKDLLFQHKNALEGYGNVTKFLKKKYKTPILGEILIPETGYELAVEVALNTAIQAVLVSKDEIKLLQEDINKQNIGKAWFLIQDNKTSSKNQFQKGKLLSDFIKVKEEENEIIKDLLDDWLVVENRDELFKLNKDFPNSNIVSIDGYSLFKGILFSFGQKEAGIIGREQRIDQIIKELKILNKNIEELIEENKELFKKINILSEEIEEKNNSLKYLVDKISGLKTELNKMDYNLKFLKETQDAEITEKKKIKREIEEININKKTNQKKKNELEFSIENLQAFLEDKYERREKLESEITPIKDNISGLNTKIATSEVSYESNLKNNDRIINEQKELISNNEKLSIDITDLNKKINEKEIQLIRTKEDLENIEKKVNLIEKEVNIISENLDKKRSGLRAVENNIELLMEELEDTRAKIENDNLRNVELKGEKNLIISELKSSIIESFDLDSVDITNIVEEEEIERLRKKLSTFVNINLGAEEEYNEIKERYDFLISQRDDLDNTVNGLDQSIKEIDKTIRVKFLDVFNEVRKNFIEIFNYLFQIEGIEGNKTNLILEEGVDPIEAEIMVVAQPPEKILRSTRALSAGETTFTALSLLYALHKFRISPLIVLDEVDAPLDDSNVERFVKFIDRISNDSQVIMVTHNRRTMEFCHSLYGVVMQKKGLSEVVSVNMERIDEILEENNK